MKKELRVFATVGLVVIVEAISATPVFAQSINLTPDGVHMSAFGYHLNNTQSLTLFAVLFSAFCGLFLFKRIVLNECDCFCGPGKCECGCGCKEFCPCFYRDKSAHNDDARRMHYNDYY